MCFYTKDHNDWYCYVGTTVYDSRILYSLYAYERGEALLFCRASYEEYQKMITNACCLSLVKVQNVVASPPCSAVILQVWRVN